MNSKYSQAQKNSLKRGNSASRDTGHYRNETNDTNENEKAPETSDVKNYTSKKAPGTYSSSYPPS